MNTASRKTYRFEAARSIFEHHQSILYLIRYEKIFLTLLSFILLLSIFIQFSVRLDEAYIVNSLEKDTNLSLLSNLAFKHLFFIFFSVLIIIFFAGFNIERFVLYIPYLPIVAIILLLLTLLLGDEGEVKRWLNLFFFKFQPSELVLLLMCIYMSRFFAIHDEKITTGSLQVYTVPIIFTGIICYLLFIQPDYTMVFFALSIFITGVFMHKVNKVLIFFLFIGFVLLVVYGSFSSEYRINRIHSFVDCLIGNNTQTLKYTGCYQALQSKIAIANGGWFGQGLGASERKMGFLPEDHNDFIFAIFVEEFGIISGIGLILIYVILILRLFKIGIDALMMNIKFLGFLTILSTVILSLKCLLNLAVNVEIFPVTGLTLPLFSYGGTSMVVTSATIGLAMYTAYRIHTKSNIN